MSQNNPSQDLSIMPPRESFSSVIISDMPYDGSFHGGTTNKAVRFSLLAPPAVQEIMYIDDLSKEERATIWYSRNEYKRFKLISKKTLEVMDMTGQSIGNENEHICMRGLEHLTRDRYHIHVRRRWVLRNEIALLRETGVQYDPDELAELFRALNAPSALEARMVGLTDELYALDCLKEGNQIDSSGTSSIHLQRLSERGPHAFRDKNFGLMTPRQRRLSTSKLLREETARHFALG
jgi:hypothetical protein